MIIAEMMMKTFELIFKKFKYKIIIIIYKIIKRYY